MPNGTYGGVRGRKTKVGGKLLLRFPPTRLGLRIREHQLFSNFNIVKQDKTKTSRLFILICIV